MSMTPRERVLAAINHEQPDRVPVFFGVSNATAIKEGPYLALKELLGLPPGMRYLHDWPELGSSLMEEELLLRLHSDARGVFDRHPAAVYERNQKREPHTPFVDSWGSGQVEITPGVWFPGLHPLADATTIEEVDAYPGWPDMSDPTRIAHVKEEAARLAAENQFAIVGTPWLMFPFERAFAMQGMDKFLMNMATDQDFAEHLLRKIAAYCKDLTGRFLEAMGENIDILWIGDDLGTQTSLLISPRMYRRILKPIHADFIAHIKERTSAKVLFHTDGDVLPLIDDFIEIGVDILNPIQTSAGRMSDLENLKARFGKNIVFCGGIDTHRILPNGSPDEVQAEVRRVMQALGPDGGLIIASVHTIMNEVPAENILAMADAVVEYGAYPLKV